MGIVSRWVRRGWGIGAALALAGCLPQSGGSVEEPASQSLEDAGAPASSPSPRPSVTPKPSASPSATPKPSPAPSVSPKPSPTPSASPAPPAGRGTVKRIPRGSVSSTYGFLEYLPPGYDRGGTFPLIIFMHGAGERGDGSDAALRNVESQGGPFKQIQQFGKDYPAVILGPQAAPNTFWNVYDMYYGMHPFVQAMLKRYRIDPKRVYMTGLSMGGAGTYAYAKLYSSEIAAILPICGGEFAFTSEAAHEEMRNGLKVWSANSMDDRQAGVHIAVPSWMSLFGYALGAPKIYDWTTQTNISIPTVGEPWTGTVDADAKRWIWKNRFGEDPDNPEAQILYTIWQGKGHAVWDAVYGNDAVMNWLLRQSKTPTPSPEPKL